MYLDYDYPSVYAHMLQLRGSTPFSDLSVIQLQFHQGASLATIARMVEAVRVKLPRSMYMSQCSYDRAIRDAFESGEFKVLDEPTVVVR